MDPDARDVDLHVTTLSGDLMENDGTGGGPFENSFNVVLASNVSAATSIDGFTITGGYASSGFPASSGAGLHMTNGSAVVRQCRFVANTAEQAFSAGGGAYASGGVPTFVDCAFEGNVAKPSSTSARGGGLFCDGGTITNCTFTGNNANNGGALALAGTVTVRGCAFDANTATRGGAISRIGTSGSLRLYDGSFTGNSAIFGGGIDLFSVGDETRIQNCRFNLNTALSFGGGIHGLAGNGFVTSCVFIGNDGGGCGGAIAVSSDGPLVTNCTISANTADQGGGICVTASNGQPLVTNSILWANSDDGGTDETAQIDRFAMTAPAPIVNHCTIEGLTGALGGVGNLGADPMFADDLGTDGLPGSGDEDLRLLPDSPLIDAGHNWSAPPDVLDIDLDGDVAELLPLDADGAPRFSAMVETPEMVCIDLGAFEFTGSRRDAVRFADVTGDGAIDIDDLVQLILDWGPCPIDPGCCVSDVDLNGAVDIDDVVKVVLNFG
jgi:hypothetical protein